MRENASREESYVDKYGLKQLGEAKKRLDLNDLLKRAENQKKTDRKFNMLIFCGTATVVLGCYLLLSF